MIKKEVEHFNLSKKMFVGAGLILLTSVPGYASPTANENNGVDITTVTQQTKKISGIVTDAAGEPIIGANVVEKGTTNGTITGIDGDYTLTVGDNAILVISYIGYKTQEIPVTGKTAINATLAEDTETLDEVVVVGYGVQKKVNLTGSVSSVNFEEQAMSRPVTNVSSALAGLSSGVQVMQSSGRPGEDGADIRIRGVGTLNNASPLVIIDGMEGTMDAVNPQDIENISILKDAASCAIYGARGANGVVLITTKQGKKDRLNVTYSGRVSYAQPTNIIDMVSNYADYMEWINEAFSNVGQKPNYSQTTIDLWREKAKNPNGLTESGVPNYVAYPNTDWQDEIFQHGLVNDHNVSVSGGSDKIRFLASAGFLDNPGLVDNTGIQRYTIRANVEADVTKWLTLGTRTYASLEDKDPGDFKNANNYLRQTCPGLYPEWNGQYGGAEANEESQTANNLLGFLNGVDGNTKNSRFNTTLYTKIKIIEGLSWDFNFNYQRRFEEARDWTNPHDWVRFSDGSIVRAGTAAAEQTTHFKNYSNYSYTLENLLRYNKTIKDKHDIGVLAGYQEYYYYEQTMEGTKQGLIDPSINMPNAATEMKSIKGSALDRATRSFFGRINYAYDSRYLFEANLRYDGSGRYHEDHRWGVFPSFAGAWRISEEAFMENSRTWLDNLKLRLSWGKLGNTGGDKSEYDYRYQSTYVNKNYTFGGSQASGLAVSRLANALLSWESTAVTNFGIDANMLNNRLSFVFDVYNKKTTGILDYPDIYYTMGIKDKPMLNIADMTNRGFEITLGWNDTAGKVNYSVSGNFSYNRNKIDKYKGTYTEGWEVDENGNRVWKSNIGDVAKSSGEVDQVVEGQMNGEYYLINRYKGNGSYFNADGSVNKNGGPTDGMIRTEKDMEWVKAMIESGATFMPSLDVRKDKLWYGDYIYADNNDDGVYGGSSDRKFMGVSKHPKFNFGWQMSAVWNGFDVSMNWAGAAGFKLYWAPTTGYNSTSVTVGNGLSTEIVSDHYFYDPANPTDSRTNLGGKYARLTTTGTQNTTASDVYLYNANYVKLKNLTIGYTLPASITSRISAQTIRFYLSGENLWNITKFPGQDPELGSTPDYTSVRQFAFGANITF